ncbi:hypothetical protein V1520DRAFT_337246 [Lipomyces starkeyi]|uniref:Pentacotripeptide-repeat region of PRORP domain-containing protein n=1 Tax=Lipomyces starkeyi NRRL Y-11557 TaxID=675824 RepID=A0A1E3QG57_LIPST|nr:hypothetical protein LIPSTDRAFT_101929 [Lipomyces starkeyi NRRL Y-11557]
MRLTYLQLIRNLGSRARLPVPTAYCFYGSGSLLLVAWQRRSYVSAPLRMRANVRGGPKPQHLAFSIPSDSEQLEVDQSDLLTNALFADLTPLTEEESLDELLYDTQDESVKDPFGLYGYFQSQATKNAVDPSLPPTNSAVDQLLETMEPSAVHQFILDSIEHAKDSREHPSDLRTVFDYMRTNNSDAAISVSANLSMEAFKDLFTISSRMSNGREFSVLTRLVGDVFYMANKVRPISEQQLPPQLDMRYILALADDNDVNNALRLWHARKAELLEEYRWWELGVELYLKRSDIEGALGAAREMMNKFGRISTYARMILFIKFCQMGQLKLAEGVYHEMIARFIEMHSRVEEREKKEKMKQNLIRTLVKCVRAALDTGHTSLGYAIINKIEEFGGKTDGNISLMIMDHLTRNAINQVLDDGQIHNRRLRPSPEAIAWLGKVVKQSLADFPEAERSQEFYRVLLNRFCELRLVDELVFLFRRMMDVGVKPTTFNVQSLLRVLLEKNRLEDARKILKVMEIVREHELQGLSIDNLPITPPIAEHYGLFLQYYARRKQPQGSKEVIARMQELKIKPTTTIFNALMADAFHKYDFGKVWSTFLMIQSSASEGVYPDAHTYQLLWRSMDRYLRVRARLYARHTATKRRAELNKKLSGDSDGIPLDNMREILVDMMNNSKWKPSLDVYVYIIRALFFSEDVMAGLCVLEICWRVHQFKLSEEIAMIVIDNLSAIVLNPRLGFNKKNIFSPAVERENFEQPSSTLHTSEKKSFLKSIIVGDLLHLCLNRENSPNDVNWDDLIKLVFLWINKVSFETNIIVYQNDLHCLRKLLGLDDASWSYA